MLVSDDLSRALERRSVRAQQVAIATAAALLVVATAHASPDRDVIAVAGAGGVVTFALALARSCREVRRRSAAALAVAPPRRVRSVARSLERLAQEAETGWAESWRTRPPRSVLELSAEAAVMREVAQRLRAHPSPPQAIVTACDRFVMNSWNCQLRALDHEFLRRELGRIRCTLVL